jgi:hypothetical protein
VINRVAAAVVMVGDQDVMLEFFVGRLGFTSVRETETWPGARWVEIAPPDGPDTVVLSAAKDVDREPDTAYP